VFERDYPGNLWELGYNAGSVPMADRDLKHLPALYSGEINYLDRIVSQFLQQFSHLPAAKSTLVVVTADHGEEFAEHGKLGHGETLYNQVLHVPLGFYWPARIKAGSSQSPVELIDVMPTVLDLLGIGRSANVDGVSLVPVISGQSTSPERPAFSELLRALGDCRKLGLPDACIVDRLAVQTERFKMITSKVPRFEELYDVQNDPKETRNVAKEFPAELDRHRALLASYVEATPTPAAETRSTPAIDEVTRERLRALGYLQ
jgi:arylsulfatase A-like enzyme